MHHRIYFQTISSTHPYSMCSHYANAKVLKITAIDYLATLCEYA